MSCLFRSLSAFIKDMKEDDLRQLVCDYMERNPNLMEDMSLNDILNTEGIKTDDYVQTMRQQHTWGGALEIRSFCEMFNIGVLVRIQSTGRDVLFRPTSLATQRKIPIVRIEWQGAHFEPILDNKYTTVNL